MSAFLLVMYALPPTMSACGPGGGCNTVRMCRYSAVGGISWPTWGVLAFSGLLAMSLSQRHTVRRWLPVAGAASALTGVALVFIQKRLCGAYCPYCLVADAAGIIAGIAAIVGRGSSAGDEAVDWITGRHRVAFGGLAAASVAGAFLWGLSRPAPEVEGHQVAELPAPIAREQRPGVATIVEFADFECPFCRRQHEEMTRVLGSYGPRVRLVRKHVPLSFHAHAMDAARAACCAEEQHRGDEMADALFRSEDLTPAGCEATAVRLGLDREAFRACVSAQRTTERIERDREDANASGVNGLPTTFVGNERFEGVVTAATLRTSIDRALRSPPPRSEARPSS